VLLGMTSLLAFLVLSQVKLGLRPGTKVTSLLYVMLAFWNWVDIYKFDLIAIKGKTKREKKR